MGLDMYLYAERELEAEEQRDVRELLAGQERDKSDGYVYVGGWGHGPHGAYDRIVALLHVLPTASSPHFDCWLPEEGAVRVAPCIGYWRKANAIHGFFVERAAGGVDECQPIPLERELLLDLAERCLRILGGARLERGIVRAPSVVVHPDGGTVEIHDAGENEAQAAVVAGVMTSLGVDVSEEEVGGGSYAEGERLADPTLAAELLPTRDGFFFGSTGFDAGYVADVVDTLRICHRALAAGPEWSFTYQASW